VYSFLDLAVLCLVRLGCERPDLLVKDSIMNEHFKGAAAPFKEFVKEEKRHLAAFTTRFIGNNEQPPAIELMDCDEARMELICDECKCCLVNFHVSSSDTLWCFPCWSEKEYSTKKVGGRKTKAKKKNKSTESKRTEAEGKNTHSTKGRIRFMAIDSLKTFLSKQTKAPTG
jgi:hypothetical protein